MLEQRYKLSLIPCIAPVTVEASQYDKTARTITFELYDADGEWEVPDDSIVTVQGTKPDNTGYQYSCTYDGNEVSFDIEQQMTIIAGDHNAEIRIINDGEILGTANFRFHIERSPLSDDTVISDTELPLVEQVVEAAETLNENIDVINTIVNNIDDVNTVADNIDDVNTVADNIDDIQNAEQNALDAEAWAVGQRGGVDVPGTDETYENNSKYYAELAQSQAIKVYGIKRSLTTSSSAWTRRAMSRSLRASARSTPRSSWTTSTRCSTRSARPVPPPSRASSSRRSP